MIKFQNVVLRVLLVTMLMSVLPSMVKAGGVVNVKTVDANQAKVTFEGFENQSVTLSIEDDKQVVVFYQENVEEPSEFTKVFDFKLLQDGDYVIVVKSGSTVIEKQITISKSFLASIN